MAVQVFDETGNPGSGDDPGMGPGLGWDPTMHRYVAHADSAAGLDGLRRRVIDAAARGLPAGCVADWIYVTGRGWLPVTRQ